MKISILCLSVFSLFNHNSISPIFNIEGDGSDTSIKLKSIGTPMDSKLGTGILTSTKKEGVGSNISTLDINGNKVYSTEDCYDLYKYPVFANIVIDVFDEKFQYLNAGSSVSYGWTASKGVTSTYNHQVTLSLSETTGDGLSISGGFSECKAEYNEQDLMEVGFCISSGYSYTYSSEVSSSYTVNYQVNEDGTYRLTKRGLFEVYVLQHYTTIYDIKYAYNNGKKYAYKNVSYYTDASASYILVCKQDTIGTGLFKYNCINGKYSLDEDYAKKYFTDTDVVFLD